MSVSDWFELEELEAEGEIELEATFELGPTFLRGDEPPRLVDHVRVVGTGQIVTDEGVRAALSLMAEELDGQPENGSRKRLRARPQKRFKS